MLAYEIHAGFGFDNLKRVERPAPQPGPGEILVTQRAWSLNYRDLLMLQGKYNPTLKFPFTPFSDGAGIVESVFALLALEHGELPGILNSTTPDPACGPQIRFEAAQREIGYAMNNSFGFGGNNCSLVFGRRSA